MVKFLDEDGNKVVMCNDDDLAEALDLSAEENRIDVWCFLPTK